MYLRNMVLVMCEEVDTPFRVYQQDHDAARLAEALKNVSKGVCPPGARELDSRWAPGGTRRPSPIPEGRYACLEP